MQSLDEVADVFDLLGDWEQRYQFLIELGEALPPMSALDRVDGNKVKGCMSQVWVCARWRDQERKKLGFSGDCDTSIIKGVVALLIQLCDYKTAADIQQLDMDEIFQRLGLDQHLSPNRHVGVYAIVRLMQQQAAALSCAESVSG